MYLNTPSKTNNKKMDMQYLSEKTLKLFSIKHPKFKAKKKNNNLL